MAKETTTKTLQTKLAISERAFRTNQAPKLSLYEAVLAINVACQTPEERRARAGERIIECRGYKLVDNVLGLYLVGYVPDDRVGIVRHNSADLDLTPAPENSDFLDGELMALIAEDALIVCRLGLFESVLNNYVAGLAAAAGIDPEDALFLFKNRTDVDKLKMIQSDGVASIRFDGVANAASVEHAAAGAKRPIVDTVLASAYEVMEALTYAKKSERPDAENLKVEVFLKFDKRSGTSIDQEEIRDIAGTVADSGEEGFEIVTLSGKKIKPNDVLLNKAVALKRYGKSVAFNEAFEAMVQYYKELTSPSEAQDGD